MLEARPARAMAPKRAHWSKILEGDDLQAGSPSLGPHLQRGNHVEFDQAECCAKPVP